MKKLIEELANRQHPICGDYETKRYGNDRMNEYTRKTTAGACVLDDGRILGIEKPRIQKNFCFHDEGADYERYKNLMANDDKMKAHFYFENLKGIDEKIKAIKEPDERHAIGFYLYESQTACISWCARWAIIEKHPASQHFREMSDREKTEVLKLLNQIRQDFMKRLDTWWKKYGVKKLNTWTYWADA